MNKIVGLKKKIIFILLILKNLNNHLTNNLNIISEKRLISSINKVKRKFV